MSWEQYIYFAMAAILLWAIGAWAAWKEKTGLAYTATIVGLVVFSLHVDFHGASAASHNG